MVKIKRFKLKSIKEISYEMLFVLCYFMNKLLKPILLMFSGNSTYVLIIAVLVLCVFFFLKQGTQLSRKLIRTLLFLAGVCMLFVIDFFIRSNSYVGTYFSSYIILGAVPLFFLSRVCDYKKALYYWSRVAVIVGVMFFLDPLFQYQWSGGYMPFGFEIMLPAFTGALLLYMYFKENYLWIAIGFFIELFICGNKGTLFTVIVIIIVATIFLNRKVIFSFKRFSVVLGAGISIYLIREPIIELMIQMASKLALNSYSLRTLKTMLGENANAIYDVRLDIWSIVLSKIEESPLVGHGIGYFTSFYGTHAHNFFLDIGVTFGGIGLVAIIILLFICVRKVIKLKDKDQKIFFGMFLCMWVVPLMMSLTFWQYTPFWCFLGLLFLDKK